MRSHLRHPRYETEWQSWFAWYPVRLYYKNDVWQWVWWETIERKLEFNWDSSFWVYRNGGGL